MDNPKTPGTPYDKTGGDLLAVWVLIGVLLVCGAAGGAYALYGRARQGSADAGKASDEVSDK